MSPFEPQVPAPSVVLVVDALYLNGAVRIAVDLLERWVADDSVLGVVRNLPQKQRIDVPARVRVRQLVPAGLRTLTALPIAVARLVRLARSRDIVVVGSEIGVGLILGFLGARLAGKPLVIGVHADLDDALVAWVRPRLRPVVRWIHRRADAAICVEDALADPIVRNGLPPSRIAVVTNGVDVDAIRAAAAAPDPFPEILGPRIVATGRLAPQKATDVLIRAHAAVVRERPHTLVILNDGPDEHALRALVEELGVGASVIFGGRMSPHPVVSRAELFCLPSRYEGMPLALLEAMALGVPCVAADSSSGVRTALDDGRAGGLVPVDDVDALAAAIRAHLVDPEPLRVMAAAASVRLGLFEVRRMINGWQAALRDVLDGVALGPVPRPTPLVCSVGHGASVASSSAQTG